MARPLAGADWVLLNLALGVPALNPKEITLSLVVAAANGNLALDRRHLLRQVFRELTVFYPVLLGCALV